MQLALATEKYIWALCRLLDDPDEHIYQNVFHKLLSMGDEIKPHLEELAKEDFCTEVLSGRIDRLRRKLRLDTSKRKLAVWAEYGAVDLLEGALIIAEYHDGESKDDECRNQLSDIVDLVNIRLGGEVDPLNRLTLFNQIFYEHLGFQGNTKHFHAPENSMIPHVLNQRSGNPLSLSILYSHIAQRCSIPVQGVNFPNHFVLACYENSTSKSISSENTSEALCYINTFNHGQIILRHQLEDILREQEIEPEDHHFLPCSNKEALEKLISNVSYAYEKLESEEEMENFEAFAEILRH